MAEGVSYQWINCDGNQPIPGAVDKSFTATESGSYAVIITLDACGLSGISDCFDINTLSQTEIGRELAFSLFPNPANDRVHVTLNASYKPGGHHDLFFGR